MDGHGTQLPSEKRRFYTMKARDFSDGRRIKGAPRKESGRRNKRQSIALAFAARAEGRHLPNFALRLMWIAFAGGKPLNHVEEAWL